MISPFSAASVIDFIFIEPYFSKSSSYFSFETTTPATFPTSLLATTETFILFPVKISPQSLLDGVYASGKYLPEII
ncbi:unknown [Clostridium sp. CAG:921]|nr:unknown [Clostridium sp. CAG:921]